MGNSEKRPVLYLNLIIHDGSEAVKAKISKKIEKSNMPKQLKKVATKHASEVASKSVKPAFMAQMLGVKLCNKLPKKFWEKGLTVEMEEVFREGPYVVLQIHITHVDTVAAAEAMSVDSGNDSSWIPGWIQWFLELFGATFQNRIESDYLPKIVMKELFQELPKLLNEKMIKKKVDAETEVLKESQQARYFYSKLKEVRAAEEERKSKNPMYRARRQLSPTRSFDDTDSSSSDEDP